MTNESGKCQYSFEEFKLIYESAEKVTDRRLAKNNQNYTFSVGILLAIAVVTNWSLASPAYKYVGFTLIGVLSFLAAIYVRLWLRQILDFKNLNAAKFKIINEMAPLIKFDSSTETADIISYEPFKKEWESLQKLGALTASNKPKIVTLKSTTEELFVPNALFVIFVFTTLVPVVAIFFHWSDFVANWKSVLFA